MNYETGSLWEWSRWLFFLAGEWKCDNRRLYSSLCQCIFVCVLCAFHAYHAVSVWMWAAFRYQMFYKGTTKCPLCPLGLMFWKCLRESYASNGLILDALIDVLWKVVLFYFSYIVFFFKKKTTVYFIFVMWLILFF